MLFQVSNALDLFGIDYSREGDRDKVIQILLEYNRISDALKYAAKYESAKIPLSKDHKVRYLASHHAGILSSKVLHGEASLAEFETVLGYLPSPDRVEHFKEAGRHDKSCNILQSQSKYKEIYKIYKGQRWHEKGIHLAKEQKSREDEAAFIMFKATSDLESDGNLTDDTAEMLKKIVGSKSEMEAKASLVYGMAFHDYTMLQSALLFYETADNLFGYVEAFTIAIPWYIPDNNQDFLLKVCEKAKIITATLQVNKPDLISDQVLSQIDIFYGFQKADLGRYSVPPSSYPWTNELLKEIDTDDATVDADGMLQLKMEVVLKALYNHFEAFVRECITDDNYKLFENFYKSLSGHPFHQKMISGDGHLTEPLPESQHYFKMLNSAYELLYFNDNGDVSQADIVKATLSAMSPQATRYLPEPNLTISSKQLAQKLCEHAKQILDKGDEKFSFDEWLEAWRISCVTKEELPKMNKILCNRRIKSKSNGAPGLPDVYVFDSQSKEYKHLMLLWLEVCEMIRDNKILASCTVAVHNIMCHIASHRAISDTLSMSNLLHIVTIHTTTILAMHAACATARSKFGNFYVPSSYLQVIKVFQSMDACAVLGEGQNLEVFKSCITDVTTRKDRYRLPKQLFNLLTTILKVIIGMHNTQFNPLKHALSNENCLKNHEAHHCLILVLILFGNIGQMQLCSDQYLLEYKIRICESMKHCEEPTLKEAYDQMSTSTTILDCFGAAKKLLEAAKDNFNCVHFYYETVINFESNPADLHEIQNPRPLLPLPVKTTQLRATAKEFHPQNLQGLRLDSTLSSQTSHDAVIDSPQLCTLASAKAEDTDPETSSEVLETIESTNQSTTSESNPLVNEVCPLKPDSSQHDLAIVSASKVKTEDENTEELELEETMRIGELEIKHAEKLKKVKCTTELKNGEKDEEIKLTEDTEDVELKRTEGEELKHTDEELTHTEDEELKLIEDKELKCTEDEKLKHTEDKYEELKCTEDEHTEDEGLKCAEDEELKCIEDEHTEDEELKCTEDEHTEDEGLKCTEDEHTEDEGLKFTEDEHTEDEGLKCTEDEGLKCTEHEGLKCTEHEGFKCTEHEGLKCTEDEGLKCTEDEGLKCTEDEGSKCTEDEELKLTEGEELKSAGDEEFKRTEDKEFCTEDEELKRTEDEALKRTEDEESKLIEFEGKELKCSEYEKSKQCHTEDEELRRTENIELKCTEDEKLKHAEDEELRHTEDENEELKRIEEELKRTEDEELKCTEELKRSEDEKLKCTEDEELKRTEEEFKRTEDELRCTEHGEFKCTEKLKLTEDEEIKDEELKITEDEELKSTEDEGLECTEDEELKSTEDEELKITEDEELKSTEDEELKRTEDEELKITENEELKSTEDEELKSTEDEELKLTEDEELKCIGDEELKCEKLKMKC